jgi:hypothetical protein
MDTQNDEKERETQRSLIGSKSKLKTSSGYLRSIARPYDIQRGWTSKLSTSSSPLFFFREKKVEMLAWLCI